MVHRKSRGSRNTRDSLWGGCPASSSSCVRPDSGAFKYDTVSSRRDRAHTGDHQPLVGCAVTQQCYLVDTRDVAFECRAVDCASTQQRQGSPANRRYHSGYDVHRWQLRRLYPRQQTSTVAVRVHSGKSRTFSGAFNAQANGERQLGRRHVGNSLPRFGLCVRAGIVVNANGSVNSYWTHRVSSRPAVVYKPTVHDDTTTQKLPIFSCRQSGSPPPLAFGPPPRR